ncbi:hypothetical protein KZ813_10655 [Sphingomonas sp. RHCKR7]|uniref:DUF6278 family protein n=1 Tax=Sphingomonas folli TaxID=2862497 RepID=UPI001C726955|nr:DUF6278 family protein [Sphingomonas folli]MBW6527300.1 hypothetical protein [Sphingomonas folli]
MTMGDVARLADRFAAAHHGERLDFSPDSLAVVDRLLDDRRRARGGKSAHVATEAGCYVGEVIRRQLGGRWRDTPPAAAKRGFLGLFGGGRAAFAPVLDLGAITVSPVEKVRARLRDTGEDTIETYYEAVERTIIPRVEDLA